MTKIPAGWKETTLGEIANIIMGQSPKSETYNEKEDGLPFYQWITEFWEKFTNIKTYSSDPIKVVEANTILFSVRAPVGKINITKHQSCIGRWNAGLYMKNGEQEFLFYLLKYLEKQFLNRSSGTVFDSINRSEIENFPISIPTPLPEQQAIAKVLSSFDDKIELLRAENQTLEQMGQELFKERFGKWKVGDELPEGWREYDLLELVNTVNWYSYKWDELLEKSNEALVTLKSFDRNWWFQTRWFKEFSWTPKKEHEVFIWDLIVAHTDLTQNAEVLGNPAFIVNDWWFEKLYITMDLVKVESKNENISKSFLYFLMKTRAFKWHCVWYSNWTTVLHLSKKAIPEFKIVLPKDLSWLKEKSVTFDLIMKKISHNFSQIDELSAIRDLLLPKLMSGEVRVEF